MTATGGTMGTGGTAMPTGSDSEDSGGSSGSADGAQYSAVVLDTDPPQLHVRRRDDENDRCTWIVLTDQSVGILAIATPDGWTPQVGLTNGNPDSCDAADPLVGGSQEASSGMGAITATDPGSGAAPCAVDVEVELQFPGLDLVEVFSASAIPVEGC
jgi:hypothetical protein